MRARFLIAGTLVGGLTLSILGWLTAAVLPPRYKALRDPRAVVETIRANTESNDIYTAPQGLFVAVALRPDGSNRIQNIGSHIVRQFAVEFVVALGLSILVALTRMHSPLAAAGFLASIGLLAGVELRFPEWNWAGFPASHLVAGPGYLAANWFITGLVLGTLVRKFLSEARQSVSSA